VCVCVSETAATTSSLTENLVAMKPFGLGGRAGGWQPPAGGFAGG
jgi:hypothetical protein